MNERSIFLAALDIADLALRADYLDQACGNDAALRKHVEELIAAEPKLGDFLVKPHAASEVTLDCASATESPGTVIGPYKLLQQIGEGGFGVVYMAEQQQPVRRKVALKIIKPGMDTREVIARFESERQALALMDHPNIARVLDGGATENGRPYFVMELVKGVPLTQFCDDNKLDMRRRLSLFSSVCKAIQHAHHKGVIHRDIKPSNVMVTLHDGEPVPKVIDFGVSKAISQQLTEKTLFTAYGQMIGTPAYMSPEQAEMSGLDIDTRSDVYSLGVLLYELLTGSTPLEAKSLRGKAYAELQRMIREDEPPRPSLRVSTRGEAIARIAAQRATGARELGALLRGELDWIVMKALEKHRDRRYESANSFAADVERYLRHEAVEACPPSAMYRLRKFIRRNRVACTTGSLVTLSLLAGLFLSIMAARDALTQRRLAEDSLRVAFADRQVAEQAQKDTVAALQEAERERDRAERSQVEESKQLQIAMQREAEAKAARQEEAAQRAAAESERDKATALNAALAKQKEQQRRMLYAAQMNLIRKAWDSNHVSRVRELLNATRPQSGESDLRGFEWHYWQRTLHGEDRTLQLPIVTNADRDGSSTARRYLLRIGRGGILTAAFSQDGKSLATITFQPQLFVATVWDITSGKQLFETTIDPSLTNLDSDASGSRMRPAANIAISYFDTQRIIVVLSSPGIPWGSSRPGPPLGPPRQTVQATARLLVYASDTGQVLLSRDAEFYADDNVPFVVSRDGSCFATPLKEPFVQVCSTDSGTEISRVAIPSRDGIDRLSEFLAFSPDGKRLAIKPTISIASGETPYGITIYELGTNNSVTTPPVLAQHLQFSPDGMRLAAWDGYLPRSYNELLVTVFDTTTGDEERSLVKTHAPIFDTVGERITSPSTQCISPTGDWLAMTTAMPSGIAALQLWNSATGESGPKLQGHSANPVSVSFSADGTQLLSAHADGAVVFWPVPKSASIAHETTAPATSDPGTIRIRNREVISPDGRWTVANSREPDPNVPVDASTITFLAFGGECVLKDSMGKVADRTLALAERSATPRFSPNSAYLLAYGHNPQAESSVAGELKVWEVSTGREIIAIRMPASEFRASEFRGPGTNLAPRFRSPALPRTRVSFSGRGESSTPFLDLGQTIAFSPDSQRLAVALPENSKPTNDGKRFVHVWDLATGRELLPDADLPPLEFACSHLAFSGSGALLLGLPRPLDLSPPPSLFTGTPGSFGPDRFLVRPGIQLWSVASGELLLEERNAVFVIDNAAASRVAGIVTHADAESEPVRDAVVWNVLTGQEIWRSPLPYDRPLSGFVMSAEGDRVALVSGSDVHVYDVDAGKELFLLQGHSGDVRGVTFNDDGSRIATSAGSTALSSNVSSTYLEEQRETKIWDGVNGQELLSLTGKAAGVISRFFSGDAAIKLTNQSLVVNEGPTWDASPLPAAIEADELASWLAAPDSDGLLPTLDEIANRLHSDLTISAEVRALAIQLARQRRGATVLFEQVANVLKRTDLPREQYQRALSWFNEAIEQSPDDHRNLHVLSLTHYRLGEFQEALAVIARVEQRNKTQNRSPLAEDLTVKALAMHQLGQRENAVSSLEQARGCASHDEAAWQQLMSEAETELEIPPASANPGHWIGRRFMPRQRWQVTDDTGIRIRSGYPLPFLITRVEDDMLCFGKFAISRQMVVPLEDASRYYTSVLEIESAKGASTVNTLNHRGITWRALGEPEKAIEDYSAAIELAPRAAVYYANRSRASSTEMKDYVNALQDIERAIELDPDKAQYHENRGSILSRLEQWDAALDSFNVAIQLDPNLGYAYCSRASVWSAKGDREKMLQDLDEGISRGSEHPDAWNSRAWLLASSPTADHRNGQLAVAAATKACELSFWNAPRYLATLAAAHAEAGNFPEAIKWQEKVISLSPKARQEECEARLALYRDGKPYHEQRKTNPLSSD